MFLGVQSKVSSFSFFQQHLITIPIKLQLFTNDKNHSNLKTNILSYRFTENPSLTTI